MFNIGKHNRLLFNPYVKDSDVLFIGADMGIVIKAAVLTGGNMYMDVDMAEHCKASISGGAGVAIAASVGVTLLGAATLSADYASSIGMGASIGALILPSLTLCPELEMGAVLWSKIIPASIIFIEPDLGTVLNGYVRMSRNYLPPEIEMKLVFDCQVTTVRFDVLNASIDIPIPPGSTLVIDSNGYVVLLDGADVIWAHNGDWLQIDRNTYDVTLEMIGGRSADKQILYTERWL